MEDWQDATSRQVKVLTSRLNELLSSGLELLHSELGVDLGLKPELIPPWVVVLAACIGLVLMVALWASTCRAICRKRPAQDFVDDCIEIKAPVKHVVKAEEVKKKKKKSEKKAQAAQPNGRAVAEPPEEAIVAEESVPHHQEPPPELKAELVSEVKKSKKKAKQTAKETKTVTANGKEPEGGTWETKVSNKEKREQRKKDKTPNDGSASPRAGDTPNSVPPEQPKATVASVPSSQKKKKGDSSKVKAEKVETVSSQVNSSETAMPAAVAADNPVKVSSHTVGQANSHSSASQEKNTLYEIDGSWTVIESGIKTLDLNTASLTGREVVAEPFERPWSNQPQVEDEWSGLNGGTVDPSSDWNAPSEAWGNFEEHIPEPPVILEEPSPEPAKDEEEEEKMETAADGAAKTKKKKKKKKRAAEDGDVAAQELEEVEREVVSEAPVKKQQPIEEAAPVVQAVKAAAVEARVERPVKESASQKPPVTPVPQKEPTAKQNDIAAPTQQKKLEESQAPKPAKKKKARRET